MSRSRKGRVGATLTALAFVTVGAGTPARTAAQRLAQRVATVRDGTARITYETRPDVEICDQGIRIGERRTEWTVGRWGEGPSNCRVGSVDVEAKVRDGRVVDIDVPTRASQLTGDAVDLGEVSPGEAVAWLEGLARGADSGRVARAAVFPIVLADVPEVWRTLMALAKDPEVPREARKGTLFWLGQEAADATEGIAEVAQDEDEDQEVRDAAVFALSQRPGREGTRALMQVARTARQAKTRRTAMFWLAQSDDPQVVSFFEEILVGRGGS